MPADDVSDLRDVVDAINRLCDTMKTSYDEDVYEDCGASAEVPQYVECPPELVSPAEVAVRRVQIFQAERWTDSVSQVSLISNVSDVSQVSNVSHVSEVSQVSDGSHVSEVSQVSDVSRVSEVSRVSDVSQVSQVSDVSRVSEASRVSETSRVSLISEPSRVSLVSETSQTSLVSQVSPPGPSEADTVASDTSVVGGPASEAYFTASEEVSLVSEADAVVEGSKEAPAPGHVAAMRERFESMTRTNTPCPDLAASLSPSIDYYRTTPSPDLLG